MSGFTAFLKKEARESLRSGKLVILASLFLLFGIMNPAIAKLTPWMLEMMSSIAISDSRQRTPERFKPVSIFK